MTKASRSLAVLVALCGGFFLPAGAANVAVAGPGQFEDAASLADAVADGRNLERARKWGEAIRHYDDALDRFAPDHDAVDAEPVSEPIRALQYGIRRSKIHYGIHRRYADPSYTDDLLKRSPQAALDLYDVVLSQVRRNYVEPIGATSLVAHGTESLYLALSDRKFLGHNLPAHGRDGGAAEQNVERFREALRTDFWNAPVREGAERQTVARAARIGRELCGLSESAVIFEYLAGCTNALDDYSTFLSPDGLASLYGNIEGNFVGIGIEIEAESGRGQFLRKILPGSPAEEGGAKAGEYISGIAGVDCRDMTTDEAAKLLRGPEFSSVELEITGADDVVRRGRFVRRTVEVNSVEAVEMIDPIDGVGYIRMGGFQETTAREMADALNTLRGQGMRKLIWDVRGNPGGLLDAAVDVLDLFIEDGVLVGTRGPAGGQTQTYQARSRNTLTKRDLEVVLLVDGDSASASEIVAGCFRDHKRGLIVGRTTYGKWSVQSIIDLSGARGGNGGSGMKLTTARFYSPDGRNYAKIGMQPDVTVPEFAEDDLDEAVEPSVGVNDELFAAADPNPNVRGERTSNYRPSRIAQGKTGPRVPQTSLPLNQQPDIRAALK
ncbi:S41 family peptidase, partial [Alienimonas chondri]|uniref:S41 family peptidase n=1 Tax=Alienimonas chondri TaxID=2681879 RepID=UPI001488975C